MSTTTDISNLSAKELKALLKQKEAAEKAEQEAARKTYETERDRMITLLCCEANDAWGVLKELKCTAMLRVKEFKNKMLEYGEIKGGESNKGNFSIENEAFKISFSSQVKKTFDERSLLAETHLKNFLNGFVKTRDKKLHKFIMGLMERNTKTGDLDIDNINRLYAMENDFEDHDWKEAIRLFKESYNPTKTTEYVRFYKRNENNGWDAIGLNFSSI
jgi:hypothetical protein